MPLLGSVGRVLWGSWTKGRLVNSNHKHSGLGKLHKRSYLRVAVGGGKTVYHKGIGEVVLGTFIYL